MKKTLFLILLLLLLFNSSLIAQNARTSKTKFVIGVSGPELLHAGFTYRIVNFSQIGVNAGIAPSMGLTWKAVSLEHRLYFGQNNEKVNQKMWFFRQGTTYFPLADPPQQFTLNLTVGKDIMFKNSGNGITIDGGVFYLPESENSSIVIRSLNLWPAVRIEFYFSF